MMVDFDPALSCPIMKGVTCLETACVFWDQTLNECVFVAGRNKQDYKESTGTIYPHSGEQLLDLLAVYKDITIYVDWECRLKFHQPTGDPIDLIVALGRVGTPIIFEGINARYLYLTGLDATDFPFNYVITGNA